MASSSKMKTTGEVVPQSQFEKLPVEVRVNIYELLPYPDLLQMRLINRQSKKEIDEHMTFHLKFDQTNNTGILRRLCSRRLRSCQILHFSSRRLFPRKIFTHPKRIKKLIFDGVIASSNLLKLLNQCNSIEHLVFTHQTLGIDGVIHSVEKFTDCLRRLTSVTHLNLQLIRYPQGDPFEPEENIEAFLMSHFPLLASFRLYFSLWGNFTSLLDFLERHRETLKELELQVGDRGDSISTERYLRTSPLQISDNQRRNLMSLKLTKFRFRDDVLNLNNQAATLIMNILMAQRCLQVLQFYSPGELTWNMLRDVTRNNQDYLTEIVVYNIKINNVPLPALELEGQGPVPEILMDMSVFANCPNLKTLALSCASSNGINPNVGEGITMKMSNLHQISSSIERLHLIGFTLDGQELVYLSGKAINLKEVLIADAGTMRYSDVLISFLKNCDGLKYLNVRPVILQAPNVQSCYQEVNNLSRLYERFMGIAYDPIDDLEGFEANIKEEDKEWLANLNEPTLSVYSSSRADVNANDNDTK